MSTEPEITESMLPGLRALAAAIGAVQEGADPGHAAAEATAAVRRGDFDRGRARPAVQGAARARSPVGAWPLARREVEEPEEQTPAEEQAPEEQEALA
jgi:hypothetical protein